MIGRRGGLALLVLALASLTAPAAALAEISPTQLVLRPVGQSGSYFDLTMRPGETRALQIEIGNHGRAAIAAHTYKADVYTIINGGFGGRLRDEPPTDATEWLSYPAETLNLAVGALTSRGLTVSVPADALPGEYITSLVLENDEPILTGDEPGMDQVIRQAVAVAITVPGEREPRLEIGEAGHKVVAGQSIISVAVDNPGNVRLTPTVDIVLFDDAASEVSTARVKMDTFYAHTATFIEVPLAGLLQPGDYTVRFTIADAAQDVRAAAAALPFTVEAPPREVVGGGRASVLTPVTQTTDSPASLLLLVLLAVAVVGGLVALLLIRRRRTSAVRQESAER